MPEPGEAALDHVVGRVFWSVMLANLVGATLSAFTPVAAPSTLSPRWEQIMPMLRAGVGLFTFGTGGVLAFVLARRGLAWRHEPSVGRRARQDVLALPWRMAALSAFEWLVAAVVTTVAVAATGANPVVIAATAARNVLAGAATSAIAFLLVERAIRPAFAVAFRDAVVTVPSTVGLRVRLLLAWVAGSAIPLLLIGSAMIGRSRAERAELSDYIWMYVLIGVIAGVGTTLAMAAAVAGPVERLRTAARAVEAGDLDASVPVDDGTEIGLLQHGFNRMIDGLRERAKLHDLFGRHVGDEVARRALDRGVELGGEEVPASAVFIDLVGSTAMAEHRSAADVVALLNDVFAVVVRAVTEHSGWVNKFEGDAALCVFGPPTGAPDHAARALRAAVQVRDGLVALRSVHPDLDAGVGVSSGSVVAGNVGAESRYEYTVIGDPVNEAARVTEQAKLVPGRLLASDRAVAAAGAGERWVKVAECQLRGRAAVTGLYVPAADVATVADRHSAIAALASEA